MRVDRDRAVPPPLFDPWDGCLRTLFSVLDSGISRMAPIGDSTENGVDSLHAFLENVSMLRLTRPMAFIAWFAAAAMLPLLVR